MIDRFAKLIQQFMSVTQFLLLANILVYAIQLVIQSTLGNTDIFQIMAGAFGKPIVELCDYVPFECLFGVKAPIEFPNMIWQTFTSMFLHGGLMHLAINMFILWQFGQMLERVWGGSYFLKYDLFSGIGSGVCVVLMYLVTGEPYGITLGASGAIFGLLLAFGMIFPKEKLYLFFAIPIEARFAVVLFGVVEFLFLVSGALPGISHIGHLGGLIFGLIMLRGPHLLRNL